MKTFFSHLQVAGTFDLSPDSRMRCIGIICASLPLLLSCAKAGGRTAASNELLIVGYDREPDTMNRYSTHILEDIQSCVIEGLVTADEKNEIVPVLAADIPTIQNGGV